MEKKAEVTFQRSRIRNFFCNILFAGLLFLVCFCAISWVGGTGAYLVQGEFLKSVLAFVSGPIIVVVGILGCVYFDKSHWYW